ncbi:EamA family transporter [Chloroflexota bacterium]
MNYLPLVLITMVLFGIHYFFAKVVSSQVPISVVALAGSIVCIPVLLAYIWFNNIPLIPQNRVYIVYAFVIGIPLAIGILTLYMAIARGPVSVVMPIYGLNAMITVLLGILILHEPLSPQRIIGIILAISAIVLLSR